MDLDCKAACKIDVKKVAFCGRYLQKSLKRAKKTLSASFVSHSSTVRGEFTFSTIVLLGCIKSKRGPAKTRASNLTH